MKLLKFCYFQLQTLLLIFISNVLTSQVPRPRGVSLSRAALYNPEKNFICFDNSKTIPFHQVNDDFCDCPDGSDEPGTAACPNGIFYCTNAGHKPMNLASSRVNDGICDCCDGSDEYANSRVTCPNVCLELGRFAREEAQKRAELIKAGKQLKNDLSQRGIQLKQEKKEKLIELQKNKEEAEKLKAEHKSIKDEAEVLENKALEHYRKLEEEEKQRQAELEEQKNRQEAIDTFNKFDSNQDGVVDVAELQSRQTFDKDRNGEVSLEEAKYFLSNQEAVDMDRFLSDAWLNIKPWLAMDSNAYRAPTEAPNDETEDMKEEQEQQEGEDEEEEDEEEEPYQPDEPIAQEETKDQQTYQYDEETQKLVDQANEARSKFNEAERAVRNIESEIKDIEDYLEKDFGPEEEFASLQGECFDYTDHEYLYRLCPFDKTTQQPKNGGGSETRLGLWGRWDSARDENDSNKKYEAMMYDRGQSCWNGPPRSSRVKISCGTDNKVLAVSEPNRCEYLFEFTTPAACRESETSDVNEDVHDEL